MAVLVGSHMLSRVIRVAYGAGRPSAATALVVHFNGANVFITAKHLVSSMVPGDNIQIRQATGWAAVAVADVAHHPRADISAIRPEQQDIAGLTRDAFPGVPMPHGAEVSFAGFPLGMEMEQYASENGRPLAFLKYGHFSGVLTIDGVQHMMIDASNNQGFSGGPIFTGDILKKELRVIGIVSGYRFDANLPVMTNDEQGIPRPSPTHYVRPNSGFMYGVPTLYLNEVIAQLRLV